MTSENREAKLLRLRDITLYHLQKANPQATCGDLDALDHDIVVWVKNLLLACQELSATVDVHQIGDNDKTKEALCTGGQ
jgi:hypothetical protein